MKLRDPKTDKGVIEYEKIPSTKARHIGIEIECFSDFHEEQLQGAFRLAGLADCVQVDDDSSLHQESHKKHSHEVKVLTTVKTYTKIVGRVCEVLQACGGSVNSSAGLHIHLDMRNIKPQAAYQKLVRSLPLLTAIVAKSRRSSRYCKANKSENYDYTLREHSDEDHCSAINAGAMDDHQTIEVRLHQGTTNAKKICNWIALLLAIEKAALPKKDVHSISAVCAALKLKPSLRVYVKQRLRKLSSGKLKSAFNVPSKADVKKWKAKPPVTIPFASPFPSTYPTEWPRSTGF